MNQKNKVSDSQHPSESVQIRSLSHQISWSAGPLPPAEELLKYNDAVPEAAERILKMAETQQHHRLAL